MVKRTSFFACRAETLEQTTNIFFQNKPLPALFIPMKGPTKGKNLYQSLCRARYGGRCRHETGSDEPPRNPNYLALLSNSALQARHLRLNSIHPQKLRSHATPKNSRENSFVLEYFGT